MKKRTFGKTLQVASLAMLSALAGQASAEGGCPDGFKETQVFGSVETQNISKIQQVGSIELELVRNENGKTMFKLDGAVMGTITGQNAAGQTLLNHVITFEDGSTIETSGDTATIVGAINQCQLLANEIISNFWGTGVFKRASGTIVADGTLGVCPPDANTNSFTLSGTVCLAPGAKQR